MNNSADRGGGIYGSGISFKKETGSVIYGSGDANANTASTSGDAVYVNETYLRNTTVTSGQVLYYDLELETFSGDWTD